MRGTLRGNLLAPLQAPSLMEQAEVFMNAATSPLRRRAVRIHGLGRR